MEAGATTVAGLINHAAARIAGTLGLDKREARLEARVLAAHVLRVDAAWLIAHDTDWPSAPHLSAFDAALSRRLAGEPIAYLTGTREFYGRPFQVTPDVLIPRPDTELLIDLALARMPPGQALDVLDLGTGSGCIAITLALERPLANVTAVDRSIEALAVAQRNTEMLGSRVDFLRSDWFDALAGRYFDLIVSNPPYIAAADPHLAQGDVRYEPLGALASGPDGLDDLRHLIRQACEHLRTGGTLLLEHGYDQAGSVQSLLRECGFDSPESWPDLAGILRVSGAKRLESCHPKPA